MQREAVRYAITSGRLFVYGTLMSGEEANYKMDGSTLIGQINTAPLYYLVSLMALGEGYYGLEHGGRESVPGELYHVSLEKLAELDAWEEHYQREYVMLEDGKVAEAYFPTVLRSSQPPQRLSA